MGHKSGGILTPICIMEVKTSRDGGSAPAGTAKEDCTDLFDTKQNVAPYSAF